jgi:ribosomal protein L17
MTSAVSAERQAFNKIVQLTMVIRLISLVAQRYKFRLY